MAGHIPQRFIEDLLARVDVTEIIGERLKLKKAGRSFLALCPFHDEKSPSFNVVPDKQFYHCFGCGAHGNALRFLMEYDRMAFPEAVEHLASRMGLEVPREGNDDPHARARDKARDQKREEGTNLLELAVRFYRNQLTLENASHARDYLEGRGLSADIIDRFAIGYAPDSWDSLKHYLNQQNVTEAVQVEYGLLVQKEDSGRTYDRFRDRVVFPIRDWKGRTVGFGGRVLGDAKPKYLNSPETPVFHKGRELYGLYEARQADVKLERLLIVEGYMDVVALAQYGIRNVVATLGTATTEDHLRRLFRLVGEVVFCFDGDNAGRQAARRALNTVLPLMIDGRQARFLFLPEGEDPDSLVRREGQEGFERRVVCASPLSEFLFEQAEEGRNLKRIEERERVISASIEWLGHLPEGVLKTLLLREVSKRYDIEEARVEALMNGREEMRLSDDKSRQNGSVSTSSSSQVQRNGGAQSGRHVRQKQIGALSMSAKALHLLMHSPALVEHLPEGDSWCPDDDDGHLLREVAMLLRAGRYRSSQVILAHFHGSSHFERLCELMQREPLIPQASRVTEIKGLLAHFDHQRIHVSPRSEYEALLAKEKQGEKLSREDALRLWQLIQELKQSRG
ncbi:DNA primase [Phytohalomonas tamaricis]|uniref:DNA primase n=1 Tax=Phytohalomonas tamaricis TaxID=2081032 RepID=UPI000D0B0CE3|nr:DNA primase [Phytohalomonas tamaricis]